MREILFRGKSWDNDKWVAGDLLRYLNGNTYIHSYKGLYRVADEVNPETVGQYTGLDDKNGVKIFEGDILQPTVYKLSKGPSHYLVVKDIRKTDRIALYAAEYEVIGNIHDNPELLHEEVTP